MFPIRGMHPGYSIITCTLRIIISQIMSDEIKLIHTNDFDTGWLNDSGVYLGYEALTTCTVNVLPGDRVSFKLQCVKCKGEVIEKAYISRCETCFFECTDCRYVYELSKHERYEHDDDEIHCAKCESTCTSLYIKEPDPDLYS